MASEKMQAIYEARAVVVDAKAALEATIYTNIRIDTQVKIRTWAGEFEAVVTKVDAGDDTFYVLIDKGNDRKISPLARWVYIDEITDILN